MPLELRPITPGRASGRLIGGNLAVLCGLMGTPFEIETAGRILFLEDVSERVYRIDRYLSQLRLAGKLQSAAGILLGTFSYDDDEPADSQAAVAALLDEYCGGLDVPVLAGFPAGHEKYNLTLPMGALVEDRCRPLARDSCLKIPCRIVGAQLPDRNCKLPMDHRSTKLVENGRELVCAAAGRRAPGNEHVLHDSLAVRPNLSLSAMRFAKRSPAGSRARAARSRRCRRS